MHFPPSKGVQYSRVFVPHSEGAWRRHSFESALCPCSSCRLAFSTFQRCAGFPLFRLTFRRCVDSSLLRERPVSVFLLPPCISHLPKVCNIPTFSSHLPKVRGGVTASRAPCISVFSAAVHFPPSEGVQDSLVFVSPSEGVRRRHCFESPLVSAFLLPPCVSHLPKVRGVATASRAPCVSVFSAAARFPPSEGVQYSHIFVSPSEGAQFQVQQMQPF